MTAGKNRNRSRGSVYLALAGVVSVMIVAGVIALQPAGTPLDWFIRAAAMLGFLAVFLTAISSVYMRQLLRLLGRPFIKIHHTVAVAGLLLITLHPLGVAIRAADPLVFVPDFSSARAFLALGGRPAWYLIAAASLAAQFRARIKRRWRPIHYLNYAAFLLATVHAVLIGTDFRSPVITGVAILLAGVLVVVFVHRRVQRWKITQRR